MVEALDFSNRRGVIVPLLDAVYDLIAENLAADKPVGVPPLENRIFWKQKFRKQLLVIANRWLFAIDGAAVAGVFFYRYEDADGDPVSRDIYIDDLMIARAYRNNGLVFPMLLDRFMNERQVAGCSRVFVGERIKREESQEILASVGFAEQFPGGYQPLGPPTQAADVLRLRYAKS